MFTCDLRFPRRFALLAALVGSFALAPVAPLALPATAAEPDRVLLDPAQPIDATRVHGQDARLTPVTTGGIAALRVDTGQAQAWPGVTISAPRGGWDLTPFAAVEVQLKNAASRRLVVIGRVDNPGAQGPERNVNASVALEPGATGTLRLPLRRTSGDRMGGWLFGMRGYPAGPGGPETVNPAHVSQILVFLNQSKPDQAAAFEIRSVRATGTYLPPTASTRDADPYFPLIDTFGQYRHKDWPGKLHSVAEMATRRAAESRELAAAPGPADWNRYGGWAEGPQLKATGFFRTEKHDGKWWMVDPEGRLFFSTGIDCVRLLDPTGVQDREHWFADFPGDQPELAEFVVEKADALQDYYAGKSPRSYWFVGANLKRKYGPQWRTISEDVIHRRLRSWGMNTLGMWSDEGLRAAKRTPYTAALYTGGRAIVGSEGFWGKFPDPFDPAFRENARRRMQAMRGGAAGDPWCIGFFSDNELSWGSDTSLAEAALRSPADQPAKREFIADLQRKYGEIAKLNAAWGSAYAGWDALLAGSAAPDRERARPDLTAFYTRIAEQYFRTVREAVKEAAPNHLYLGCRFSLIAENALAAAAASKYCDVVSYNVYQRRPGDFSFRGVGDVPFLVGEFHFGALDRGLFHTGLVPVENQAERAAAFTEYVTDALRDPRFVGCHWFEYNDEATTGRVWDGENFQIGFVDIADTPYPEMAAASRAVTRSMYRTRAGR